MNIVGIVLTIFCGVTALISASGKLTKQQAVVEILDHVKVTGTLRTLLPYLQLAGASQRERVSSSCTSSTS